MDFIYFLKRFSLFLLVSSCLVIAQEDEIQEEITVVGSQIKGASITGALPVTVYSIDDIEALGIDSGDELLENITEQGQNEFAESSETGGINSSRGDMGAYNLRNISAGNTLVLLNGRRLVTSPGFQTELIGGGFTPVSTVNSNLIPTSGLDRVEVLRDGASAIYGADAVAGVVNNVINRDFEGMVVKTRAKTFSEFNSHDRAVNLQFGTKFNNGDSHITLSYDFVRKGHAEANEHPVMSQGNLSVFLPGGVNSEYESFFDNTSSQAYLGQFDMRNASSRVDGDGARNYVDPSGEFQVLPIADPRCAASEGNITAIYDTGFGTCIVSDSGTNALTPWNKNAYAWVRGKTDRHNLLINLTTDLDNGMTLYNEIAYYDSNYFSHRDLSTQYPRKLAISAASFYNPLRSGDCLPGEAIGGGCTDPLDLSNPFDPDAELMIDNFRFGDLPRTVDVEKETWRFLQGLNGTLGDWDFDGAIVWSKATSDDLGGNRIDFLLMQQALFDTTAAGYNFLCDWVNDDCSTNIEQTLVSVTKSQESELKMFDLKFSKDDLFETNAGSAGFLIGVEYREETYVDDRDPRLDGTINFHHLSQTTSTTSSCRLGDPVTGALPAGYDGSAASTGLAASCHPSNYTYPYIGAIMGGTATADSEGSRYTSSLFAELGVPLADTIDMQVAARYESTSDFGNEMVGKFAIGWQASDSVLLRASASTTFKAPNLVAMNQPFIVRFNSGQQDYAKAIIDTDDDYVNDWIYRRAEGNPNLKAETSDNFSIGAVFEPVSDLVITLDAFKIDKKDTVGVFGTSNETALDLLNRWNARTGAPDADAATAVARCLAQTGGSGYAPNYAFNSNVVRSTIEDDDYDDMDADAQALGLCPVGNHDYVLSNMENLADRTVEGFDVAVYYDWDTNYGSFALRYKGAFTTKLEQDAAAGSKAEALINAIEAGTLADAITQIGAAGTVGAVVAQGYGALEGTDSYFEDKHSARFSWRLNAWSASLTARRVGDYVQSAVVNNSGVPWTVDAMTTYNMSLAYRFDIDNTNMKITFGSNNLTNEDAPLAADTFGFDPDVHNGYGRTFYLDLRASF